MNHLLRGRRVRTLASAALATAGSAAWAALLVRLQLRGLHMLQQEGYQTGRYLQWSAYQRDRWASQRGLTAGAGVLALAGLDLLMGARLTRNPVVLTAWTALGSGLWQAAKPSPATKPLVLTSRARRLLAGQSLLSAALVGSPAAICALRPGNRQQTIPALIAGAAAASLLTPLITAGANLLLWPVEEGFRRYYLVDARRKLRAVGPTVVAVSGSYGKTSTKELTATILAARWHTLKPPGSFNTPMGISRTIRERLEPSHEVFVAELGDYVPGDIAFLCDLVSPSIGILTTIGPEHLERFKTMERIVQTKEELIGALPADGVAIINQDDPLVRAIGDRAAARGLRVVRYGQTEPGAQVRARNVATTLKGLEFVVEADGHGEARFAVGLLGRHNVMNLLAATGAALAMGMSLPEIAAAARRVEPVEHRLQPIHGAGGVLVIDDTYNSNPSGAAEALTVLGELPGSQKVLVTPGMIELAEREIEEHQLLGQRAAAVCDWVILVGPERTRPIAEGLRAGGFAADRIRVVENRDAATATLGTILRSGDVVLWENDLPDTYAEETSPPDPLAHREATSPPDPLSHGETPLTPRPPLPQAGEGENSSPGLAEGMQSVWVDGLKIAYRVDGPPDAPTVVVLHGWGASSAAVASIQTVLSGTHRTIAPDLPGFGASDAPPVAWGAEEYAASVRAFLAALGIGKASFIGHSHGGRISIVLAATSPELVDRLVLVDSAGLRSKRGARYYGRVYVFKAGRQLLKLPVVSGPLRRRFEAQFGSDDYRQAGSMRGTLVRVVNEDWRHLLPRVQASTLLIWGELDDATPLADGQLMEQMIPDAGLVVFPGAGHYAYADDLPRFARVVGHFLA